MKGDKDDRFRNSGDSVLAGAFEPPDSGSARSRNSSDRLQPPEKKALSSHFYRNGCLDRRNGKGHVLAAELEWGKPRA